MIFLQCVVSLNLMSLEKSFKPRVEIIYHNLNIGTGQLAQLLRHRYPRQRSGVLKSCVARAVRCEDGPRLSLNALG